jgi:Homocysteine/selenocysteine methylase (S-methylmethionine-dependent)
MSYDAIKTKLENNKVIILDGGMGAELEKNGNEMDKHMWCGKCSVLIILN